MVLILHSPEERNLRQGKEMMALKIDTMNHFFILYRAGLVSLETLGEVSKEYQLSVTWFF